MLERGSLLATVGTVALLTSLSGAVAAQEPGRDAAALDKKIAIMGFDALGMDSERVASLEALFRMEIDRLSHSPAPTAREMDRRLSRRLKRCGGTNKCLTSIGKRLGVDLVVSSNVAALGDSYVVNIKVVEVASGKELRRIVSDPLRGRPDELIDAIRVAAYRLLAPDHLKGSIEVLADRAGAIVKLDGAEVGKTPLERPLKNLPLGKHKLEVVAEGFSRFSEDVRVRFQKSTKVIVHLEEQSPSPTDTALTALPDDQPPAPAPQRWYESTWFLVGAGVATVALGSYIGYRLGRDTVVNCNVEPQECRN